MVVIDSIALSDLVSTRDPSEEAKESSYSQVCRRKFTEARAKAESTDVRPHDYIRTSVSACDSRSSNGVETAKVTLSFRFIRREEAARSVLARITLALLSSRIFFFSRVSQSNLGTFISECNRFAVIRYSETR